MKILLMISMFAGAVMTSCASLPPEIDKDYLSQMTPAQAESLKKSETAIIAKKGEEDIVGKRIPLAEKMVDMSKARLKILEATKELSVIEILYSELQKDQDKLGVQIAKRADIDKQIDLQKKRIPLSISQKNTIQSLFDLKTAELAALIADLTNTKAVIANEYLLRQSKVNGTQPETRKKINSKIDIETFSNFLETQQKSRKRAAENYAVKLQEYNILRDEAVKAGYKGEDDLNVK